MKKMAVLLVFFTGIVVAQNKQILYGFNEIPEMLMQNPGGQVNDNGHIGLPLLAQVSVNAGNSGPSVYDIFAKDNTSINIKLANALVKMKPNNFISLNEQIHVISLGYAYGDNFEKNNYVTFGLYQELDAIAYYPKDFVELAYYGNQDRIGHMYKMQQLNLAAEAISVLHIGLNKKINEHFTYGIRGKLYMGSYNVNSTNNQGYFVTNEGQNNYYDHLFNLNLALKTSGINKEINNTSPDILQSIRKNLLFGGNLGLGIDVGFTSRINEQWYVDGSILDVGFIHNSKDIQNYSIQGQYTYEGLHVLFPKPGESGQSAEAYWNEVSEEFKSLFKINDSINNAYTTWRPIKLNASLNYEYGTESGEICDCINENSYTFSNRIGIQVYGINRPKQPQFAVTAYYYKRLFNGLSAKATYTVDSFSAKNLGLGLSTLIGPVNVYLMADNFLQYSNIYDASAASFQLGINYIINKK